MMSYKLNNELNQTVVNIESDAIRLKDNADQLSSGNVSHHKAALKRYSENLLLSIGKLSEYWSLFSAMLVYFASHKEINAQFESWRKKKD